MSQRDGGELAALFQVAQDDELSVLDRLAIRAGLIWVCPVEPWNNDMGEPCGECGRTQVEAAAYMKMSQAEREADEEARESDKARFALRAQ